MGNDRASLETADLAFFNAPKERIAEIEQAGLDRDSLRLHPKLDAARAARQRGERTLVARADAASGARLAPSDILNISPLRELRSVEAGGGLVLRPGLAEPEVLLIFRRGAWDLPKGKRDAGESFQACALREVREEVGIARLAALAPAGTTVHGYPEGRRYVVKRTAWYFMATPERSFQPEAREGIEQVAWAPWSEAATRVGFESLRQHLRSVGPERAAEVLRGV